MDWPFEQQENTAVVTLQAILDGEQDILFVSHDRDDGTRQFLAGGTPEMADARVVALEKILVMDPSISEVSKLPKGWIAWRQNAKSYWKFSAQES